MPPHPSERAGELPRPALRHIRKRLLARELGEDAELWDVDVLLVVQARRFPPKQVVSRPEPEVELLEVGQRGAGGAPPARLSLRVARRARMVDHPEQRVDMPVEDMERRIRRVFLVPQLIAVTAGQAGLRLM